MSVNQKSIVVSFSIRDESFHRETLLEYTQGNALRILKNHPAQYFAIAVVETEEEADVAIARFSRQQRVARGTADPELVNPRSIASATPA